MPAEILNRLESLVSEVEASIGNKSISSSIKTDPLDPLAAEMRAMKFIWNLPIITLDFLHEDEKICGICDNKYDKDFRVCGRESPCCLPCGHIAGHQCLREWLSPYECGFVKCPFCNVEFPQMFTDSVEPVQPTSDLAWEDDDDYELSDDELSRQVSQLSRDSGVSNYEVKRYLSIDEVLENSRSQTEGSKTGTVVRDFATQAATSAEIGENEFPKDRKDGGGPILARAAVKAVDLVAKNS